MILAFGGTTEGRTAIEVLEEAGKPYYYSTRTDGQRVPLHHGIRLTGTMDANEMARFCRERDIRLLVDAAHPFAIELHRNVASTAQALGLPAIRLERLYPDTPATRLATWCQDYTEVVARLETLPVRRILALTGVQTIAPLRPLWDDPRREVYFRILDRADSHALALAQGFPPDRLCHYHPGEDEALLMQRLRPDAIILKESGQSGGFLAKTEAACGLGIATFIVRRPPMPPGLACADGPHGLRRLVESLLPGFYDQRSGLTTGTCATASAVACVLALFCPEGEPRGTVPVILPDGETLHVAIAHSRRTSATCAEASTLKDGGDDPDVTNGLPLCATLSLLPPRPGTPPGDYDIDLRGGPGIGTVTLPGLGIAVGSPAINATPRRMILDNMARQLRRLGVCPARHAYRLALSAPGGEAAAARTLNPPPRHRRRHLHHRHLGHRPPLLHSRLRRLHKQGHARGTRHGRGPPRAQLRRQERTARARPLSQAARTSLRAVWQLHRPSPAAGRRDGHRSCHPGADDRQGREAGRGASGHPQPQHALQPRVPCTPGP